MPTFCNLIYPNFIKVTHSYNFVDRGVSFDEIMDILELEDDVQKN
jgi:hypothetical protein